MEVVKRATSARVVERRRQELARPVSGKRPREKKAVRTVCVGSFGALSRPPSSRSCTILRLLRVVHSAVLFFTVVCADNDSGTRVPQWEASDRTSPTRRRRTEWQFHSPSVSIARPGKKIRARVGHSLCLSGAPLKEPILRDGESLLPVWLSAPMRKTGRVSPSAPALRPRAPSPAARWSSSRKAPPPC